MLLVVLPQVCTCQSFNLRFAVVFTAR